MKTHEETQEETQEDSPTPEPNGHANGDIGDLDLNRSLPATPGAMAAGENGGASNTKSFTGDSKTEKDRILTQSKKQTPLQKARASRRDDHVVHDPTTGGQVHLENSKPQKDSKLDKKLDPANSDHKGAELSPPQDPQPGPMKVNPHSSKPGNILLQQFPPPVEAGLINGIKSRLHQLELGVMAGMALIWFFLAFGNGAVVFFLRTGVLSTVTFGLVTALHLVERQILRNVSEVRMQMERQRGEEHSPPTPESVEWLNGLLATVWPLIPSGMLSCPCPSRLTHLRLTHQTCLRP